MRKQLKQIKHLAGARKLSLLDRLRGWHWSTEITCTWYNEGQAVRRRNWCGCTIP